MKMLIGFVFGLMVASALAQVSVDNITGPPREHSFSTVTSSDLRTAITLVPKMDQDGYVICSDQRKP